MSRLIPHCSDCSAEFQQVQIDGETVWRCPWSRPGARPRPGEARIECGRPYLQTKHPSGLSLRSVQ